MWEKVLNIGRTAESFLRTDKAPPGTPTKYIDEMKATTFLASKKFFVVFSSVILIALYFGVSVFILFLTAPLPTITAPFVMIFCETIKIFAIIISSYLGIQAALDFKMNSSTSTNLSAQRIDSTEEVNEKIIQEYAEKYKNDPSYAPLEWSQKGEQL